MNGALPHNERKGAVYRTPMARWCRRLIGVLLLAVCLPFFLAAARQDYGFAGFLMMMAGLSLFSIGMYLILTARLIERA